MLVDNIIKISLLVTAIAIATIGLGIAKQLEQLNSTVNKIEFNTDVIMYKLSDNQN
jgi:uncharacterized protein YoxC